METITPCIWNKSCKQDLKMILSQVNVLCHPGGWITEPALGLDSLKLLHGEQSFEIHKQLSPG